MHRSKNTRGMLVSTCIMRSIRCSSSHSAEVGRKEGASKHDKNTVTLGTRSLKVFLLLFSHSSALCPLFYQAPGAWSEVIPDRAQQQRRCQRRWVEKPQPRVRHQTSSPGSAQRARRAGRTRARRGRARVYTTRRWRGSCSCYPVRRRRAPARLGAGSLCAQCGGYAGYRWWSSCRWRGCTVRRWR